MLSRPAFLGAAGIAALPFFAEPARALEAIRRLGGDPPLPPVPSGLAAPNVRGAALARESPFIRAQYGAIQSFARSIGDAATRADALSLLADPKPTYALRYPTQAARLALRDALAREGFIKPGDPVSGIFPRGVDGTRVVLPFWAAPGSADDSHHCYPGGLLVHELFNAQIATHYAQNYDAIYFSRVRRVDRDLVIAAALYHDVMKTVVFQYNEDGTFLPELSIGDTGGHHCLSGAEAIVRGRDPRFVIVLLSAHAAPSLGDQAKVVTWCRAAAMIAGVDPVEYGLLAKTGSDYELAALPPIEAFVNHLSDHDYVLTVHAAQHVLPELAALAPRYGVPAGDDAAMRWWRLGVLSRGSAVALYYELARGESAFKKAVNALETRRA